MSVRRSADPPAAPRYFAVAARGTEEVLAAELREIGEFPVDCRRAGVAFGRQLEDAYRACLWSRVASRVLLPLATFEAPSAEALYEGVAAIDWTEHLGPERTMAVQVAGGRATAGPSHFVALKSKDAIVDRIRAAEGARPNVDKRRADLRVHLYTDGSRVTVSLDLAGGGLHHRGLPRPGAAAPLRETLAAALLRLTGWPSMPAGTPLHDPMCGSATFLTEAAGMALDLAPGLLRERFGAEGWRGHDAALWSRLRDEARERRAAAREVELRIRGTDSSAAAVRRSREIIARAGLRGSVEVQRGELRDARPEEARSGVLITNPPYGERIGEPGELGPLYELLGDVARRSFPGWTAWVLCGDRSLAKRIGLRPASRRVVFNGPIECRFLEYPISTEPVQRAGGPGWRRPGDEARGFANRLRKNSRRLSPWAARERLDCYRLYDADIPIFNVAVDRYGPTARVEEYAAPRSVSPRQAADRLRDVLQIVAEVLEIDPGKIALRVRHRLKPGEQHGRFDDRRRFLEVREGDLRFRVNLSDYIDTGLFLDDRLLRREIGRRGKGRHFLNLFSYTCTASVAAAAGGALSTTSVDLSRNYLAWGRENFALNGLDRAENRFLRADARRYGGGNERGRYGLIFVAPPSRSRSKGALGELEIQRDHGALLSGIVRLLATDGEIVFSTNRRDFALDHASLGGLAAEEITERITPPDFAARPRLRAWILRRPAASIIDG